LTKDIFLTPLEPYGEDKDDEKILCWELLRERIPSGKKAEEIQPHWLCQQIDRLRQLRHRVAETTDVIAKATGLRSSFIYLVLAYGIVEDEFRKYKEAIERLEDYLRLQVSSLPEPA